MKETADKTTTLPSPTARISPRAYAAALGCSHMVVMRWLDQEAIPGAEQLTMPDWRTVWSIPADAPHPPLQAKGRPRKAHAGKGIAPNAPAKASKGRKKVTRKMSEPPDVRASEGSDSSQE